MQPLNPFLRAFFKSSLISQCAPVQNYILLAPTTEVLLNSCDHESGILYADLIASEEFLGSHVLRIPNHHQVGGAWDESLKMRENRGKATQYSTFNGRMVIVKDSFIYSNKGFKTQTQAQLLSDTLIYPDLIEQKQWLIYFISKPLVGTCKEIKAPIAVLPKSSSDGRILEPVYTISERKTLTSENNNPKKKKIKTFNDLLNNFPMIARQMQPGLEHLFQEINFVLEKPLLPPPPAEDILDAVSAASDSADFNLERLKIINPMSCSRWYNNSVQNHASVLDSEDPEDGMRTALETAVTNAIDLFKLVDQHQISLVRATTELTGPMVDRMIEQYIIEQVHDTILYPRLCALNKFEDLILDSKIRQMSFVDISQVGIPIPGGQKGKHELNLRLRRAVDEFRKLGVAGSPQQMMGILLTTLKTVTKFTEVPNQSLTPEKISDEKLWPVMTINADSLVPLLLIIVIRSKVRHLQARLSYMRNFIFIDNVDSGEMGYALSTYEAVLSYIMHSSAGLRSASVLNKRLWKAVTHGDIKQISKIFESDTEQSHSEALKSIDTLPDLGISQEPFDDDLRQDSFNSLSRGNSSQSESNSSLCHVFPWQNISEHEIKPEPEFRKQKTVTMDMRSLSSCSETSFRSRVPTISSINNFIEADTSIERLSQTQNELGESLLMMAVQSKQSGSLQYLLSLKNYYSSDFVLGDVNKDGSTLLSAAVQLGHTDIIDIILGFLFNLDDPKQVNKYLGQQDMRGRSIAHYLFNYPRLITKIGHLLPWSQKDKNGQTPLFAICRSYDHGNYDEMVEEALRVVISSQENGKPVHLDDHVDAKGNTLLHIINDPRAAYRILRHCKSDVNATNYRKFTPLMVASKYGRLDIVQVLFGDQRLDLFARELRGLTAVELAKDDDVRNRIDDLSLFQGVPDVDGRITSVVRSFFVQDATVRLILKSGAPNNNQSYTITTCRRSIFDFEHLVKLLALEHPASWLPSVSGMRSPFQLINKPSRAVLRDIQIRLDSFLKILLSHSTFGTHEMLWEFFLVPEIQPEMMEKRSRLKMESRIEKIREEFEPIKDVRDVEKFVHHASDMVRGINYNTVSVARRANQLWRATTDLYDSCVLVFRVFSSLDGLPRTHISALETYVGSLEPASAHPYSSFHSAILAIHSTITAMLSALSRPISLITNISATKKSIERSYTSLNRNARWPLGILDETRQRINEEKAANIEKEKLEVEEIGRELTYTWGVVAGELAGWQEGHEIMGRKAVKDLVKGMVIRERSVLDGMNRALRKLSIKDSVSDEVMHST